MGQQGHWQEASDLSVDSEICNPNKSATDTVGGRKQFCTFFVLFCFFFFYTCGAYVQDGICFDLSPADKKCAGRILRVCLHADFKRRADFCLRAV